MDKIIELQIAMYIQNNSVDELQKFKNIVSK